MAASPLYERTGRVKASRCWIEDLEGCKVLPVVATSDE
jgi:hypothetical protein